MPRVQRKKAKAKAEANARARLDIPTPAARGRRLVPKLVRLLDWEFKLATLARKTANDKARGLSRSNQITWSTADAIQERFSKASHIFRINLYKAAQGLGEVYVGENPFWVLTEEDILRENRVRCKAENHCENPDMVVEWFTESRILPYENMEAYYRERSGEHGATTSIENAMLGGGDGAMIGAQVEDKGVLGDKIACNEMGRESIGSVGLAGNGIGQGKLTVEGAEGVRGSHAWT